MTVLLFFCVMLSGSAFCAAKFRQRTDITFPITCMGFDLLLFLFGIAGFLQFGFIVSLLVAIGLWRAAIQEVWKFRNDRERLTRDFLRPLLTPGLLVFAVFMAVQYYALRGSMAHLWDEFSHWIDIVKVMTTLNDFGTNPLSNSSFQSYPPAITLFQYIMQKIYLLLHPNETFSEWLTYMGYQFYLAAVTLPLFRRVRFRKPFGIILLGAMILGSPMLFYKDCYFRSDVDTFLAVLAGAGFSTVIFFKPEEKDWFYSAYIFLVIATLILTKDVGVIFSVFLAILYMGDKWMREGKLSKQFSICAAAAGLSVLLPKLLWKWKLAVTHASIRFETHIDTKILFDVLAGRDTSYRAEVLKNYKEALAASQSSLPFHANYWTMFFCTLAVLAILFAALVFLKEMNRKSAIFYMSVEIFWLALYVFGMCVIYMFNFSEYEAVRLASLSRYLGIALIALWITISILFWQVFFLFLKRLPLGKFEKWRRPAAVLLQHLILFPMLLIFLFQIAPNIVKRTNYHISTEFRAKYEPLTEKIMKHCGGNASIFVVSQATNGLDYWVLRFSSRPNIINNAWEWSIGDGPFYEGDIYTRVVSPDELREQLTTKFNYIAIYHTNDFFKERYAELFETPADIADNTLFQMNASTGMLHLVE